MSDVVKRFVEARKEAGFTQDSAAAALGIRQQSIGMFETGEVTKPKYLPEAASLFGVRYDWLMTGNPPKTLTDFKNEKKEIYKKIDALDEKERELIDKMADSLLAKKETKK